MADVTSIDIRCNQMGVKASTATVAAGSQLGFMTNQAIYHAGPVQFYMAKVPAGSTVDSWDGSGEASKRGMRRWDWEGGDTNKFVESESGSETGGMGKEKPGAPVNLLLYGTNAFGNSQEGPAIAKETVI